MSTDICANAKPIIAVVGPTASGKSSLAIALAEHLNGEVVSADSMQVYKGMDIGTAKVTAEEQTVYHFGLDLVNPGEPYSAALFQDYARSCFSDIQARSKTAILCGGTGFYVRAAIDDFQFPAGEQTDNPIREQYHRYLDEHGACALWDLLKEQDPESAAVIAPADSKRVIRAFELLSEGESYAQQKERFSSIPQKYPAIFIGLSVDPDSLRNRIDTRVDAMFSQGLVEEVTNLLEAGFREGITAPQAIGYKEVVAALDGQISMDEAREKIKFATHRFAKRQRTWFRKDKRIHWINADDYDIKKLTDESLDIISNY